MPKNQFQRPMPVRHDMKVPRHGKAQPPAAKAAIRRPEDGTGALLPPLASLMAKKPQG